MRPFNLNSFCPFPLARLAYPVAAGCAILLWGVSPLAGDHTERTLTGAEEIAFRDRTEAWAMKYFAGVSLFSGFGPPRSREPHSVNVAFEVAHIPRLSRRERRVGFDGTKEEDTNKAPLVLRPRITMNLTNRISFTGSYVPPIKVFDVKTELVAASLNASLFEAGGFTAGARCFAQYGKVRGDITCPADKLDDPAFAPHCEEASNDTMHMRTYGVELGASYRINRLRGLTPYLTFSYQTLRLQFDVDAVMPHGFHDQRKMRTSGETWAVGAGATFPITDRFHFSAGVVYMPNTVRRRDPDQNFEQKSRRNEAMVNARVQFSYDL